MLDQNDLSQIAKLLESKTREIVREEIKASKLQSEVTQHGLALQKILTSLKNLQIQTKKISSKLGIVEQLVDDDKDEEQNQFTKLEQRVIKLEKHVGVKTI